jgi:segregation and condensation protein A
MEEEVKKDVTAVVTNPDQIYPNLAKPEKVSQEQIHSLLFGEKLSWQSIIYDLINSEQLDPWDIDLSLLSNKYLEKIRALEEANFFISSKVLLAAALLLRMKSERLLEVDIKSLDEILFGKKEEKKYLQERIELDEEIPGLVPRTPLPRFRKVTLEELMTALNKAIKTETRRIKRVVTIKQQEIETALSLPKHKINLQDRIKMVYSKLEDIFENRKEKLPFTELAGTNTEERIANFIPLLHLDNQQKVWVEQEGHLQEIYIWLKSLYEEQNKEMLEKMKLEVEQALLEADESASIDAIEDALAEDQGVNLLDVTERNPNPSSSQDEE